ncbi:MAG TPA: HIT domain-containing protein, partial [Oligoflexia bacterium]|nr:HIT domain-containing protein [Oligoflexia bacterium]
MEPSQTDCIFCKIVAGTIPAKIIEQNEHAMAFLDLQPQAPFHGLVIPKMHVASLNQITPSERRLILPELYEMADQVAIKHGFREDGYRCVINNQALAGQSVFHLHLHVLGG